MHVCSWFTGAADGDDETATLEFGANFEGWGGHGGYLRNDARGSPEDGSPHLFYTSLMVRQGPRHQRIHVPAQISAT